MPKADELEALANRCEAAAHSDRKIDQAIEDLLEAILSEAYPAMMSDNFGNVPRYTASLDAAMTLATDLLGLELAKDQNDRWSCELSLSALEADGTARAATPALAFTAAALRARAATLREQEGRG